MSRAERVKAGENREEAELEEAQARELVRTCWTVERRLVNCA